MRVHQARHTFDLEYPAAALDFAIARHVRSKASLRQRRIDTHEPAVDPVPDAAYLPCKADLLWALDALPERRREATFIEKVSGLSLEEVAQATSR